MDSNNELMPLHPQELIKIEEGTLSVGDLWWKGSEMIQLKAMADSHLKNTVLALLGFGYKHYNCTDELRSRWIKAFQLEWQRRIGKRGLNK